MKILVAGSIQGDGGYEEAALCGLIAAELRAAGHTVDHFMLPYERNMLALPEQLTAYSLLQINDCDQLITVGYPACVLNHPNKVCYLLQMEPMLAEYWDSQYGVLANRQYSDILQAVMHVNDQAQKRCTRCHSSYVRTSKRPIASPAHRRCIRRWNAREGRRMRMALSCAKPGCCPGRGRN